MLVKLKVGVDYLIRLKTKAVLIPKSAKVFIVSIWNSGGEGIALKTMFESWDSITVLCLSAVLLGVTELCTACYRLIKQSPFSERVALSPRCKLAMREGLQLHDCALMLGSFYQVLKICVPQSEDCTRLSLLQCNSGYDNCHLQLRLDMAWGNFSAPGILL